MPLILFDGVFKSFGVFSPKHYEIKTFFLHLFIETKFHKYYGYTSKLLCVYLGGVWVFKFICVFINTCPQFFLTNKDIVKFCK